MADVRLMTVDPGHFHAGLIQKEMYPGVAARVDVYAPLGWDLVEHLKRVAAFNNRSEKPTAWQTGSAHEPRLLRAHAPRTSGQRGRPLRPQSRQDRPDRRVGPRWPERPRGQTVDPLVEGSSGARGGPGRCRCEEARRVRHHDRALRDHDDPPARARERSGGVRRGRARHSSRSRRLHGERPPPDEGGRRRAQHPAVLVLRHGRAGRGLERHRDTSRRSGSVDAVS